MSPIYVPGKVTLAKDYTEGDRYFSNVSLLLHGDGANGSTTIVDNSPTPKIVTTNNGIVVSTSSPKFGSGSLKTGDIANSELIYPYSVQYNFGTGDFTVELQFKYNGAGGVIIRRNGETQGDWALMLSGTNLFWQDRYFNNSLYFRAASAILDSNWHHIAVSRQGTTNRMFFDGVQQGATVTDSTNYTTTSGLRLGGAGYGSLNSFIDDLRITAGVARYTANFTPPTAPFADAQY